MHGVTAAERQGDMADTLTGAKRTTDEEAHDFFGALYEMSTWKERPTAPRPSAMLRRLGLVPDLSPNLSSTLGVIVDTLNKLQAAREAAKKSDGASDYGLRSQPPAVPAPPTLAPEPLMLSPLQELPYLFALEAPEVAGLLQEGAGKGPHRGERFNRVKAKRKERVSPSMHWLLGTSPVGIAT